MGSNETALITLVLGWQDMIVRLLKKVVLNDQGSGKVYEADPHSQDINMRYEIFNQSQGILTIDARIINMYSYTWFVIFSLTNFALTYNFIFILMYAL